MARITTYTIDGTITDDDKLLGTDAENADATKNYLVGDLATFITSDWVAVGSGTTNYIPLWTPDGHTIGDSIMFQSTDASPTIQVGTYSGPGLQTTLGAGFISASGIGADQGTFTNITSNTLLTIRGNAIIGNEPADTLEVISASTFKNEVTIDEKLIDAAGYPGTAGQVLSSTATGTEWIDDKRGTVTGKGGNLVVPMWKGNAGSFINTELQDSPLNFVIVDPGNLNDYGLQFGGYAKATGIRNSVSLGYDNLASNNSTIATGHQTKATGLHASSFNFQTTASGDKSAAFGSSSTASGNSSFAVGLGNTAATSNSFAGGLGSTANPVTDGKTAFAYGSYVNAYGNDSAAFGTNNTTTGDSSFVAGANSSASTKSFSLGVNNFVPANGGALGHNNNISTGLSYAFGYDNTVQWLQTMALGFELTTTIGKQRQVVIGYKNEDVAADFIVGTGGTSGKANGLEVYKDKVILPQYGNGTVTGEEKFSLQVDSAGQIIEGVVPTPLTYLTAIAIISQSGANPPVINNILENTLGLKTPMDWTYIGAGEYELKAVGKFKALKTIVFINGGSAENNHDISWEVIDADKLRIRTHNSNGKLTKAAIEIRTYN